MPNLETIELRNRIIGILIRSTRERSRCSRKECATVLGVSSSTFAKYENGSKPISLPELELLTCYMTVPLHTFRQSKAIREESEDGQLPESNLFLPLRHRIIGAQVRQLRLDSGRTQQDLADILERSPSTISDYEYGRRPIPFAELELIAQALEVPLDTFMDHDSEVGLWHQHQEQFEQFSELPLELQEFVLRPINRSYLELAVKLSEMPAGALREIAEGLLEITY